MWLLTLLSVGALLAVLRMNPGRGDARGVGGVVMLLRNPGVQEELGLDADQREQVRQVVQGLRRQFEGRVQGLQQLAPAQVHEQRAELMREMSQEARQRLAGVLGPEQLRRLWQIELQYRGAAAFDDPEVQAVLQLTGAHLDQLKAAVGQARQDLQDRIRSLQAEPSPAGRAEMVSLMRQVVEQAIAILSETQRQAWHELVGAPFTITPQAPPDGSGRSMGRPGPRGPAGPDTPQGPFSLNPED
jgi:hypothetical protein